MCMSSPSSGAKDVWRILHQDPVGGLLENRLYTFISILIKSSDFKGRVKKKVLLFYLKVSTLSHIPFLAVLDAKMFGAFFKSKSPSAELEYNSL